MLNHSWKQTDLVTFSNTFIVMRVMYQTKSVTSNLSFLFQCGCSGKQA